MSRHDIPGHIDSAIPSRPLKLDKIGGKLAGVCAGLGDYFGVDPLIIRLIFVLGAVVGLGSVVLVYLLIWLLTE